MIQGLLDREEQRREKMKELGIKYEYKGFKEIIEGKHDDIPESAFYMAGTIEDVLEAASSQSAEG